MTEDVRWCPCPWSTVWLAEAGPASPRLEQRLAGLGRRGDVVDRPRVGGGQRRPGRASRRWRRRGRAPAGADLERHDADRCQRPPPRPAARTPATSLLASTTRPPPLPLPPGSRQLRMDATLSSGRRFVPPDRVPAAAARPFSGGRAPRQGEKGPRPTNTCSLCCQPGSAGGVVTPSP